MADDRETERRIRAWLDDSAPDRLPVALRASVERETARPSGGRYSGDPLVAPGRAPFGRLDRLIQVAAAVGIVAIVASTVAIYQWSRQPVGTANPSVSAPIGSVAPSSGPTQAPQAIQLGKPVSLGTFWTSFVSLSVGGDGSVAVAGSGGGASVPAGGQAKCNGDGIAIVGPDGARHDNTGWNGWIDAMTSNAPFLAIGRAASDCSRSVIRSGDGRAWEKVTTLPADLTGSLSIDWLMRPSGSAEGIAGVASESGFRTLTVGTSGATWSNPIDAPGIAAGSDSGTVYAIRSGALARVVASSSGVEYTATGLQLASGWTPDAGITGPVFRGKLLYRIPGDGGVGAAAIDGSGQVTKVFDAFSPDGYAVNQGYVAYVGELDGVLAIAASADGAHWTTTTVPDAKLSSQHGKFDGQIAAAPGRIVAAVATLSGNEELFSIPVQVPSSSATATPAPSPTASATPTPAPTYSAGSWAKGSLPPGTQPSTAFSVHGLPNGGFVAFEQTGSGIGVFRSPSGDSWIETGTIAATSAAGQFTTSRDGSRFVVATGAAGQSAAPSIWYSDDLYRWTRATFDGAPQGTVLKLTAGGSGYVAITGGSGAPTAVWKSSDGATWSRSTGIATADVPFEVISRDGAFLLYASRSGAASAAVDSVWTSADGSTWTAAAGAVPFGSSRATIVALGGELIAYDAAASTAGSANGSSGNAAAWRSTDGIHWSGPVTTDLPRPAEASGLRFDSVGGRLLAVWPGGATVKAWQSTDGTHWTSLAVPLPDGAALDVLDASFDDDGTTLVLSGSNTVYGPGQTARSEPFIFALPVASLP